MRWHVYSFLGCYFLSTLQYTYAEVKSIQSAAVENVSNKSLLKFNTYHLGRIEAKAASLLCILRTHIEDQKSKLTGSLLHRKRYKKTLAKLESIVIKDPIDLSAHLDLLENPDYERYLPKPTFELYCSLKKLLQIHHEALVHMQKVWQYAKKAKPIGKGGFGRVFMSPDGQYVFKEITKEKLKDKALNYEVNANRLLMSLIAQEQENSDFTQYHEDVQLVTAYYGTFESEGEKIMVFERVLGSPLNLFLEKEHQKDKSGFLQSLQMSRELARRIAFLHKNGLIHRDIKPSNAIALFDDPNQPYLKLIDHGFTCKSTDKASLKRRHGTTVYLPPEGFSKTTQKTTALDVYALGVSLLKCFFHDTPLEICLRYSFFYEGKAWKGKPCSPERLQAFNKVLKEHFDDSYSSETFNRQNAFEKILPNKTLCLELAQPNDYEPAACVFILDLIRDCLHPKQEERPSIFYVQHALDFLCNCLQSGAEIPAYPATRYPNPDKVLPQMEAKK